jgi:GYF domain 2
MNNPEPVFYLGVNGQESGPFPETEIRIRLAQHQLQGDDLCWRLGWTEWKTLAGVFPGAAPLPAKATPTYAPPPASPYFASQSRRVFIEGDKLVVSPYEEFPPICIRSGDTEDLVNLECNLSWHPPAVYLGLFGSIFLYVILAYAFRRKATYLFYISAAERSRQIKWHLANWGLFVAAFLSLGYGVAIENTVLGLLGAALFIATIVIYYLKVRILYAAKIDQSRAYIGGIPREVMLKLVANWP